MPILRFSRKNYNLRMHRIMCVTVVQGALLRFSTLPTMVTKLKGFSYREKTRKINLFVNNEFISKTAGI